MHRLAGLLTFAVTATAPFVALAGTAGALAEEPANPVPEPAAIALFAVGALVVGGALRYRRSP